MYRLYIKFAVLSVLFLGGCAMFREAFRQPDVKYDGVSVRNISFSGAEIVPRFVVDNPNHVGGHIKDVEYRVILDGIAVTENRLDTPIAIRANDRSEVELPLPVGFLDIYRNYEALRGREAPYRIEGSFKVFAFTFPIEAEGTIQVPDLPNVKITDLQISGGEVSFTLLLDNKNGTAMDITRFAYSVKLNGKNITSGRSDFTGSLGPASQRRVAVRSSLSLKELAELGLGALEEGKLT